MWAYGFLGEPLTWSLTLGSLLVLISGVLLSRKKKIRAATVPGAAQTVCKRA